MWLPRWLQRRPDDRDAERRAELALARLESASRDLRLSADRIKRVLNEGAPRERPSP